MNVYFVYKVLTNRIRALIIAAGYIENERYWREVTAVSSPRVRMRWVHLSIATPPQLIDNLYNFLNPYLLVV